MLRVGQKIETGKPITWCDIFVMCSLLTAFGSMAGAAALHFGWPIWSIFVTGTSADWIGFGTMRLGLVIARNVASQLTKGD